MFDQLRASRLVSFITGRSAFGHRHLYISWVLSALAKETERLPSTALETVNDICSTSSENVSCWKLSLHWLEMVNLSAIKGNMDEATPPFFHPGQAFNSPPGSFAPHTPARPVRRRPRSGSKCSRRRRDVVGMWRET